MKNIFVTGIGTDVGKTVAAAVLVAALKAAYWKPVQAGALENSDSKVLSALVPGVIIFPEAYRLNTPMSPHAAADLDNVSINLKDIVLPKYSGPIVVEGAGGILVPLNRNDTMLDLICTLDLPVVLVSKNYLGSINHTLLSVFALLQRRVKVLGLIFNGEANVESESIILQMTKLPCLGRIDHSEKVTSAFVKEQVKNLRTIDFS